MFEPRQPARLRLVRIDRECLVIAAAGMGDMIDAAAQRTARPRIEDVEDERRLHRDHRMKGHGRLPCLEAHATHGDLPGLAEKQIEIVDCAAERTKAGRLIVCPSYYTDDPVLDRVFGQRPEGYLEALGKGLDPAIEIFWTGPRVCSTEMPADHLARVTETLKRRPFIWDNYPVNDGQRMSPFLHLRAFTGRPAEAGQHMSAHGVNPASQPMLSRIPMLSLETVYGVGTYDSNAAFLAAAETICGAELAQMLAEDLPLMQDKGLNGMDEKETAALRNRYLQRQHPLPNHGRRLTGWPPWRPTPCRT